MKNRLISLVAACLLAPTMLVAAENKPLDENGISVKGDCAAIAAAPDGSAYLLMRDHRIVKVDYEGVVSEIALPKPENIDDGDYYADIAADDNCIYLSNYSYSGIFYLDLGKPDKLNLMKLQWEGKSINPMMVSKSGDSWCIRDAEERIFKVDEKSGMTLLPKNSYVELDGKGQSLIQQIPEQQGDTIVYPGKVNNSDGTLRWAAPAPVAPRQIMSIDYLGYDTDQNRDIYLVYEASGELDEQVKAYSLKNGDIDAERFIPVGTIDTISRYCKVTADGAIIAVYADEQNPDKVILKRFELKKGNKGFAG